MSGFATLFRVKLKIRFREWLMVVLLLAFPLLMVGINGALSPDDIASGMETFLPGGVVIVIVIAGIMFQSFTIASDKGKGVLRRVGTVPTPRATYLIVESFVTLALIALVLAVLFAVVLPLGVEIRGSPLSFVAVILLGALTLMAIGSLIAGFLSDWETALMVSSVFMLLFFFPAFIPPEAFSSDVQSILKFIPSVSLANILRDLISDSGTLVSNLDHLGIITIWLVVCWIITALTFRWE